MCFFFAAVSTARVSGNSARSPPPARLRTRFSPHTGLLGSLRGLHTSALSLKSAKDSHDLAQAWNDMLHFDGWEDVDPAKYLASNPAAVDPAAPLVGDILPNSTRPTTFSLSTDPLATNPGPTHQTTDVNPPQQTWSEYMGTNHDDDSPWSNLDAFADSSTVVAPFPLRPGQSPAHGATPASATDPQQGDTPDTLAMKAIVAQMVARQPATASASTSASATSPAGRQSAASFTPSNNGFFDHLSDSGTQPGQQTWSEYMGTSQDDDNPWSNLDVFADSSAVPTTTSVAMRAGQTSAASATPPLSRTAPQPEDDPETLAMKAMVAQMVARQPGPEPAPQAVPTPTVPSAASGAASAAASRTTTLQPDNSSGVLAQKDKAVASQPQRAAVRSTSGSSATVGDLTSRSTQPARLTHVAPPGTGEGGVHMVDVSKKPATRRSATAQGRVWLPSVAVEAVRAAEQGRGPLHKGPVFHTAQLAGIMGAKRTSELVPLCHPVALSQVEVELAWDELEEDGGCYVVVRCTARTTGPTGVEMEALTGASTACLTVWDMVKAVAGTDMVVDDLKVVAKSGGRSGDWRRLDA